MEITIDRIVVGGIADNKHWQRARREAGATMCWHDHLLNGCTFYSNGWHRILRPFRKPKQKVIEISALYSSDHEIGYRRFRQDLLPLLLKTNRSFRLRTMHRWIEDLAGFEFYIDGKTPLSILEGECYAGYMDAHLDEIYKRRKARGEFDSILKL